MRKKSDFRTETGNFRGETNDFRAEKGSFRTAFCAYPVGNHRIGEALPGIRPSPRRDSTKAAPASANPPQRSAPYRNKPGRIAIIN
ncbi:MAG: hypothetical protein LBF62_05755 [Tannerellaceae bacterium]|nr:hypothetical protein [Tannerellaceae bacterium]